MTSPAPQNATGIAMHLARLARELDDTVRALDHAERDAVQKRAAYDLAFSRAFVRAEGSVDMRKHIAVIGTEHERAEADVADTVVRHLRRRIDAIKTRIDVGRSYGAAVRAELALGNVGDQP